MERQKARVQVPQSRARGYPVYRIPAPKMEMNQLGTTLYAASGGAPTRIWSLRIPTRRQTSNSTAAVHSSCTSSAPGICWQDGRSGQHAAGEESVGTQTTNDPGGGGGMALQRRYPCLVGERLPAIRRIPLQVLEDESPRRVAGIAAVTRRALLSAVGVVPQEDPVYSLSYLLRSFHAAASSATRMSVQVCSDFFTGMPVCMKTN